MLTVMEVLNALITEADRHAVLTPLPGNAIKYRASVYADDLVIFLAPTPQDLSCIRQILELFAGRLAYPPTWISAQSPQSDVLQT